MQNGGPGGGGSCCSFPIKCNGRVLTPMHTLHDAQLNGAQARQVEWTPRFAGRATCTGQRGLITFLKQNSKTTTPVHRVMGLHYLVGCHDGLSSLHILTGFQLFHSLQKFRLSPGNC